MPIKDLSENIRWPRLGKIRTGYKDERGLPKKSDHFVLPKEHSAYNALIEAFGAEPKLLRILIPSEDKEQFATQYYRSYSLSYGLLCKGDGETATRMVDAKTEELPGKQTETTKMIEVACNGKECPNYQAKKCRRVMNFKFMLPEIPGLGVWQIDTSSVNSITNINSGVALARDAYKRVSMIPFNLTLEPYEGRDPSGKKQTVYVLNLRVDVTLTQLAIQAKQQAKTLRIGTSDLEAEYEAQVERDIEELWPEDDIIESTAEEVIDDPDWEDLESAGGEPDPEPKMNTEQQNKLAALIKKGTVPDNQIQDYMFDAWKITSTKELTEKQAGELIEAIETGNMKRPETAA